MKFIVSSSELLKAILTESKAIPAKTTDAILEDYLFVLNGNTLEITASDKEITLRTTVTVDRTDEEGRIAVPARQLTDLLRELPDQPLSISTLSENAFECAWASGASTLPYNNPDDYPDLQSADESVSFKVSLPAETLADGIASTIYAASDEESRPVMSSIYFDIRPQMTTFVACDLQKLICYNTDDVKAADECSFILNKRHAAVLKSVLGKEENDVDVVFDKKTVVFKFGNTIMICVQVAGKYPAYKTIIPTNNSNILRINRAQLLNTVKRIAVCSPKGSSHIKFDLKSGSLEVSAQDVGYELAAHEKVACSYDGDDLSIGFKSTHIIEILANMPCNEIQMKFADKRRSALVLPSDEEAATTKVYGIVMPIIVK